MQPSLKKQEISYNVFTGKYDYDNQEMCYHGKVINIPDLILFEGETILELTRDFKQSINDYLELLKEAGRV